MDNIAKKITDSELELMELLWERGESTVTNLRIAAADRLGWDASMTKTLLSRLVTKEAVIAEKRDVFHYTPNITREEYRRLTTRRLIDRLFGGSARNLAASLVDCDELTAEDIAELRAMFAPEDGQ